MKKTLLKSKIALLIILGGVLFSCKSNDNKYPQDNPTNGSDLATDSSTTTQDNYNTNGTTVAPGASNTNSGTSTGSSTADPNIIGPSSTGYGATGSGTTDGSGSGNTKKADSTTRKSR